MSTLELGDVTVTRVIEIDRSSFPTASMLPDSTPDAIARHHHWLRPHFWDDRTGDLASRVGTYIVKTPRHTVLIDTGVGNDKPRAGSPVWHMRQGAYLDDLHAAGVTPGQVDVVLCTHLHVDHVGWNTRLVGARWVPTFPNALYIFAGEEWEFWRHEKDECIADSVVPVVSSRFCYDLAKARDTRRAFVERHADSGVLVLAAHFPTPGFIVKKDGGCRFAPVNGF